MKLSVVIPAYNESETLADLIDAVRDCGIADVQIVVVDDASTDGTTELLRESLHEKIDTVLYHPVNKGKGAALFNLADDIAETKDLSAQFPDKVIAMRELADRRLADIEKNIIPLAQ